MMAIASSYPRGNYPDDVYLETVFKNRRLHGCHYSLDWTTGAGILDWSTGLSYFYHFMIIKQVFSNLLITQIGMVDA